MAPPARRISQEEWGTHEPTIKQLYYIDKLPLCSKSGGKRTLVEYMEDEYGFSATPAQYETQLKRLGAAKNLEQTEWQTLLWQHRELEQQGRQARIVISGAVVDKPKLKRARGRHVPKQHIGYTIPPERQAYVEFRDDNDTWSRYEDNDSGARFPGPAQVLALQNIDAQNDGNSLELASAQAVPIQSSPEIEGQQMISLMELAPLQTASSPFSDLLWGFDESSVPDGYLQASQRMLHDQFFASSGYPYVNNPDISGRIVLDPASNEEDIDSLLSTPFYQRRPSFQGGGFEDICVTQGQLQLTELSTYESFSSSQAIQTRPIGLAEALLQCSRRMLRDYKIAFHETDLPDVEDVIDNLDSLLPENIKLEINTSDSRIIERNASFGPGFTKLLYSIVNGFAGLRDIPRSSILNLIRENHQILSHILQFLKTSPCSIAKPLADNLFRATVESCDPEALEAIMNLTRHRPDIAIDPNDIVCKFGGEDYTPIELAAKLRNTKIVQTLLAAKADPNKRPFKGPRGGALELAVRKSERLEPVNLELVKLLLDHGAEIRVGLLEEVVQLGYGYMELLQVLMSKIPDSRHSAIFKSIAFMRGAIDYLEGGAATGIVRRFFSACKLTECGNCPSRHPELLQDLLVGAAKRGNIDLVQFLIPYTGGRQLALAAAVRSGDSQIVNLLFANGATVDGPAGSLDRVRGNVFHRKAQITTPLAEAIRAQDHAQVQDFEQRGALTCLTNKDHFEAALFAAAEAGDFAYVKKVLKSVPTYDARQLTPALSVAIRNDHTETALFLLDAGASVNYDDHEMHGTRDAFPLVEALKRRNTRVIDSILESDIELNFSMVEIYTSSSYMELAGVWGDFRVIEDLALMGANLDSGVQTTALVAAVTSRNRALVDWLLQLGASVNVQARGASPLEAAIRSGDHGMLKYLLSQGAAVTDSGAFEYAAKHDRLAYNTLLLAFIGLSPADRKGFGGRLLMDAIAQNDLETVDILLKAKVDINRVIFQKERGHISPLGFAIKHKKGTGHAMVRKLLKAGGDPNSIAKRPVHMLAPTNILETPLLLAIHTRNEEMADILIKAGAHVNKPARRGLKRTPLQEACKINSFKMVEFLLLRGARADDPAAERGGHTALQLAAINGSIKIAQLLLDNGADPHGRPATVGGKTAFEGAAEHGCLDILKLLNGVARTPFDQKELERARDHAKTKGHRGCVDYIDSLLDA